MAESADALDSGSSGSNTVCVQVTLSAPRLNEAKNRPLQYNAVRGIFLGIIQAVLVHLPPTVKKFACTFLHRQ